MWVVNFQDHRTESDLAVVVASPDCWSQIWSSKSFVVEWWTIRSTSSRPNESRLFRLLSKCHPLLLAQTQTLYEDYERERHLLTWFQDRRYQARDPRSQRWYRRSTRSIATCSARSIRILEGVLRNVHCQFWSTGQWLWYWSLIFRGRPNHQLCTLRHLPRWNFSRQWSWC